MKSEFINKLQILFKRIESGDCIMKLFSVVTRILKFAVNPVVSTVIW